MSTPNLTSNTFEDLQILVIGDAMIDQYYYGEVNRTSPEADVPILDVSEQENRLGGAANVALNIAKMGAKAHLMTFNGQDAQADILKDLLQDAGIGFKLVDSKRKTTVKTRLYNGNTYQMRFDYEDKHAITDEELAVLLKHVETACQELPLAAIVLQDYNKGLLTEKSIDALLNLIAKYAIPVAVDPKEANFLAYKKVDLFKPNLKEVNKALSLDLNGTDRTGIEEVCKLLQDKLECKQVLITLAQNGAVALDEGGFYAVAAHERNVIDVSGAGDTVIAMASLLLGLKYPMKDILKYSNLAGGLVIEERGVKALSIQEWLAEN